MVELDVGGKGVYEGACLAEAAKTHRELGDARALSHAALRHGGRHRPDDAHAAPGVV